MALQLSGLAGLSGGHICIQKFPNWAIREKTELAGWGWGWGRFRRVGRIRCSRKMKKVLKTQHLSKFFGRY